MGLGKEIAKDVLAGVITGLIIGDEETVFPIDMIAIPAFQAHMLSGTPSMQVYIKAGETLVPTGGNVADMTENMDIEAATVTPARKKKKSRAGLPKKYAKMGFKKGWAAYKKTAGYKRNKAKLSKKIKKTVRRRK